MWRKKYWSFFVYIIKINYVLFSFSVIKLI